MEWGEKVKLVTALNNGDNKEACKIVLENEMDMQAWDMFLTGMDLTKSEEYISLESKIHDNQKKINEHLGLIPCFRLNVLLQLWEKNASSKTDVALFGMPYLYQAGDVDFHSEMVKLGLSRGKPLLCGLPHKAIITCRNEYFLVDYEDETAFCDKYDMIPTYTMEDFVEEIRKLKRR